MARFYTEFYNQFFFITAASLLAFGLFLLVANLTYYNIAFIPSVSELIVLNIGLRITFLSIVFLSQTSRTILYVEIQDHLNFLQENVDKKQKNVHSTVKRWIQVVIIASYLQTLFFLLVAIVDVDKYPLAHAIVTLVAFLFAILRQVPFIVIKAHYNLQHQFWDGLELLHCLAIVVFICVFGAMSYFRAYNPYEFNSLFEYIAVYLVLLLPLYNYPVVEYLIDQRRSDFFD